MLWLQPWQCQSDPLWTFAHQQLNCHKILYAYSLFPADVFKLLWWHSDSSLAPPFGSSIFCFMGIFFANYRMVMKFDTDVDVHSFLLEFILLLCNFLPYNQSIITLYSCCHCCLIVLYFYFVSFICLFFTVVLHTTCLGEGVAVASVCISLYIQF